MTKNKQAILLSLGHNSSAIYTDGEQVIGYEQERLDRIKSSSKPPLDAINEIFKQLNKQGMTSKEFAEIPMFATHWFDAFNTLPDSKYLVSQFGDLNKVRTHTKQFTHHDAHAFSGVSFMLDTYKKQANRNKDAETIPSDKFHVIVADGFGNFQETVSIYSWTADTGLKKIFNVNNYAASLGLMYQYATSYSGMKENQDEYKFLGYENKIDSILNKEELAYLSSKINKTASKFKTLLTTINDIETKDLYYSTHLIDYELLKYVRETWYTFFKEVFDELFEINNSTYNQENKRVIIGYIVQSIIQLALAFLIEKFKMTNVVLSGGIFYNVKLNNSIMNHPAIKKISVVPLAGDQGASIGFYEKYVGHFPWGDLCWGKRDLPIHKIKKESDVKVFNSEKKFIKFVTKKLLKNEIVSVFRNSMEFGPRALCRTSTLALPTKENTAIINVMNDRNEVMPMAPLILEDNLCHFFFENQYNKVIGSDEFMIITYDLRVQYLAESIDGVMHKYPIKSLYSARPQKINEFNDPVMCKILSKMQEHNQFMLVNTSFNRHGEPIVYSVDGAIDTFNFQKQELNKHNLQSNVHLAIYTGDK